MLFDVTQRPLHDDFAAMHARARAEINDVIGAAHRLFIMLDDHERVSLLAQRRESIEQAEIITRMQTNRRFIEHIKNAA